MTREPGEQSGAVEGAGRRADHQIEALAEAQAFERGGHSCRDDAPHAAALDHESDAVGVAALPRSGAMLRALAKHLRHRMDRFGTPRGVLVHTVRMVITADTGGVTWAG